MFKNTCWVNWLFTIMVAILALISISSALSGCGNKGALYLPDTSSNNPSVESLSNKKANKKTTEEKLLKK